MIAVLYRTFCRLSADERGIFAVMTALGTTILMGAAGLAIDVAVWELAKSNMQGAADQAVSAAVMA